MKTLSSGSRRWRWVFAVCPRSCSTPPNLASGFAEENHEKPVANLMVVEVPSNAAKGRLAPLRCASASPAEDRLGYADKCHEAPPASLHSGSTLRAEGRGDRLYQSLQARDRLFVPKPIRAPFSDNVQ